MAYIKSLPRSYRKTCLKRPLSKYQKCFFKTNYHLMQVKSIAEHSAILSICIKQSHGFKTFLCLFLSGRLRQVSLFMYPNYWLPLDSLCTNCPSTGLYQIIASLLSHITILLIVTTLSPCFPHEAYVTVIALCLIKH